MPDLSRFNTGSVVVGYGIRNDFDSSASSCMPKLYAK
jgi:hypothetical protein